MADYAFRKYDPETLRRLQNTEIEVLKAFDGICRELGLSYFVHYGALLGAMRHKGPIPWDDDLDVAILRDDFTKFVAYCDSHPDLPWGYMDSAHRSDCTKTVPLFYKKGTVFAEDDLGWRPGIGIDVFPFDYLPNDERACRREIRRANFQRRIMYLCNRDPRIPYSGWKYYAAKGICKVARGLLVLFRVSGQDVFNSFERNNIRSNERNRGSEYVTTFFDLNPKKSAIRPDQFDTVGLFFDGEMVRGPKDPDMLLRLYYGDYMVLPPEEQRVNHAPVHLDFGDGKGDVLG